MTESLTKKTFLEKIFNYEAQKDWKYEGDLPAIVDFWAEWCGPCKMIAPVLEEISNEYEGKLRVFKVNTDEEQELSSIFSIQSIPALLFIPLADKPQVAVGALPKETLLKAMKDVLNVE